VALTEGGADRSIWYLPSRASFAATVVCHGMSCGSTTAALLLLDNRHFGILFNIVLYKNTGCDSYVFVCGDANGVVFRT
jgi:hypothetical protein